LCVKKDKKLDGGGERMQVFRVKIIEVSKHKLSRFSPLQNVYNDHKNDWDKRASILYSEIVRTK
jgi:hypothetical protein